MNPIFSISTYLDILKLEGQAPNISVKLAEALLAVTLTNLLKEQGYEIVDGVLLPLPEIKEQITDNE